VITDPAGLRTFLLESAGDLDGLHVQFHNIDEAGQVYMAWTQLRVFRRGRYRYIHREHELPQPTDDQPRREKAISVVFEHRPPSDRAQAKLQPMIDRLALDVEEHPDDPHPVYFLHRQYALAGQWREAIDWGQRYLSLARDFGVDRCEAYGNLAHCHLQIDQAHIAIQYLHRAAADQPQRRIWWIRLAEVYFNQHEFNLALALLRLAAELWPQHEQHYQPVANTQYLYQLIQRCQAALATGEHNHG
jgi:tetratricopeptide (TPR) repeat protein